MLNKVLENMLIMDFQKYRKQFEAKEKSISSLKKEKWLTNCFNSFLSIKDKHDNKLSAGEKKAINKILKEVFFKIEKRGGKQTIFKKKL